LGIATLVMMMAARWYAPLRSLRWSARRRQSVCADRHRPAYRRRRRPWQSVRRCSADGTLNRILPFLSTSSSEAVRNKENWFHSAACGSVSHHRTSIWRQSESRRKANIVMCFCEVVIRSVCSAAPSEMSGPADIELRHCRCRMSDCHCEFAHVAIPPPFSERERGSFWTLHPHPDYL